MFLVQDVLISKDVFDQKFICDLNACKGVCCREGDFGAPVTDEEIKILKKLYPIIRPYLTEEGQKVLDKKGVAVYYKEPRENGTPLLADESCAFLTEDENGVLLCGIERAWEDGAIDFKKPVSCHLYPIRISENEEKGFEAMNYEAWEICKAACSLGKREGMPLFRFVKEAIIRKYGADFYAGMEAVYGDHFGEKKQEVRNEK